MPSHKEVVHSLPPLFQKLLGWETLEAVDPATLGDNPRNWKTHPPSQLDAALAAIKRVGWVLPLLYNLTTSRLIDGHGRKAKAVSAGLAVVPVAKGRWTEEEENFLLHSLDSIGSMYLINPERLKSLSALVSRQTQAVSTLTGEHKKALDKLTGGMTGLARAIEDNRRDRSPLSLATLSPREKRIPVDEEEEDSVDSEPAIEETVPLDDVHFPGDPTWEIPELDSKLLCLPSQVPRRVYDRSPESVSNSSWYCLTAQAWPERQASDIRGGTLGLFCDDYQMMGFYDNPGPYIDDLKSWDFDIYCQPDFSTYDEWPFPLKFWMFYKSRWVARYWQAHGLRILPVLHSVRHNDGEHGMVDIALELNAAMKPPVVACQCRTIKFQDGSFEEFGNWLSNQVKTIKPYTVVIYGGSTHRAKFEGFLTESVKTGRVKRKVEYVYLPAYMDLRRTRIASRKQKQQEMKNGT